MTERAVVRAPVSAIRSACWPPSPASRVSTPLSEG